MRNQAYFVVYKPTYNVVYYPYNKFLWWNMKEYLECGKIANTHGVKGAMIIESWCDSPDILASLSEVYTEKNGIYVPFEFVKASVYKGRVMCEIKGIDTLEDAAALKNTVVYAKRSDLPISDGSFFVQDLIGCDFKHDREFHFFCKFSSFISTC